MARLIHHLGGEEELLLGVWAGDDEGQQVNGDPVLADPEGRVGLLRLLLLGLVVLLLQPGIVGLVLAEVDVLGLPLLPLPPVVELAVARQAIHPTVEEPQDLVDMGVRQLRQAGFLDVFKGGGHVSSEPGATAPIYTDF